MFIIIRTWITVDFRFINPFGFFSVAADRHAATGDEYSRARANFNTIHYYNMRTAQRMMIIVFIEVEGSNGLEKLGNVEKRLIFKCEN